MRVRRLAVHPIPFSDGAIQFLAFQGTAGCEKL
jgi:hypothetical protein